MITVEKNATYLYIGNVANGKSNGQELIYSDMPLGSVALVKAESAANGGHICVKANITGDPNQKLQIVQKTLKGEIKVSPIFTVADIVNKTKKAYSAPVQQVSYIGATSDTNITGIGNLVAGNTYILRFYIDNFSKKINNYPLVKSVSYYALTGGASAGVDGFYDSFYKSFSREAKRPINCYRVVSGTQASWSGTATHILVTNGSTSVIYTDGSGAGANGQSGIAVGTVIRIKGVMYKVASTSTTSGFTIDRPYLGPTEEIAGGTTASTQAGIVGTPGNYGLKFVGVPITDFNPIVESYDVINFDITSSELYESFGVTEYKATTPDLGSGYWMQVQEMENYSQGLEKVFMYAPSEVDTRDFDSSSSINYDLITLNINYKPYTSPATGITLNNLITIIIASANSLSYNNIDTALGI